MRQATGACIGLAVMVVGCGSGNGTTGSTGGPVISVGGDYTMTVELAANDCGVVTVLPLPTRVAHVPGSLQFQLTHGPNTYQGTLEPSGGFRTAARTFADATSTLIVNIEGRFLAAGLEGFVTVDQTLPAPACRYLVRWTGAKQGASNVIP
jgi:hypothetical protein